MVSCSTNEGIRMTDDEIKLETLNKMEAELMEEFIPMVFSDSEKSRKIREDINRLWERIVNEPLKQAYRTREVGNAESF